jgi:hypothetical protein
MNDRTKAAIIGGVVAGVLSVIPIISNCCFLWALAGGVLAVFMYLRNTPATPMEVGDGAKLGLMAGGIGAGIYLIISLPIMLIWGGAMISQQVAERGGSSGALGTGLLAGLGAFVVVVAALVIAGCGALGGLIGAAIFGKKGAGGAGPMPPPPPTGGYTGGMPPQPPPPPAGGPPTGFGTGS